jgi:hypothetical protein
MCAFSKIERKSMNETKSNSTPPEEIQKLIKNYKRGRSQYNDAGDTFLEGLIGQRIFVRTVTHHNTGILIAYGENELILADVSWVADDGRHSVCMSKGKVREVEHWPAGVTVFVGRGGIIDVTPWNFPQIREVINETIDEAV